MITSREDREMKRDSERERERAKGSSHGKQLIKMYSRGSATDDAISSDTTHLGSESRTKWERQTVFRALKGGKHSSQPQNVLCFPSFSSSPLHSNYFSFSFKLLFRCQILYSFCRIKVSEFEIRSILLMLSSFCLTFKAAFFTASPFDCCSCSSSSLSLFLSRCTFLSFPHTNAMPVLHLSFSTSSLIPLERKTNRSQGRRRKEMKVRNSRWHLMWRPHEMQGVSSLLSLSFSLSPSLSLSILF